MPTNILDKFYADDEWDGTYPWDKDEVLHTKLERAGWRYAILIGITDPDEETFPLALRAEDRQKYGYLIHKTKDGVPVWHNKQATTFVAELSGASREISASWLDLDWHDGGEV